MKRTVRKLVLGAAFAATAVGIGGSPAGAAPPPTYTCTYTYEGTTYTFETRNPRAVAYVEANGGSCTANS